MPRPFAALAPLTLPALALAAPLAGSKPNIIFIFSDDHAPKAMGAYGSPFGADVTPRLDAMAKEGVTFENCVCGNPLCGPSRAIVLTGKFSHANRYYSNEFSPAFDGKQPTLPKLMAPAGYSTAIIGKWHLASTPQGFDHFDILPGHGNYYSPELIDKSGTHKNSGYVTELLTDRALDWMKSGRDKSKPFVLMLHHKAPHRNWLPGPNEAEKFKGRVWPEPTTLRDDYASRGVQARDARMRIADHMTQDNDLRLPSPAAVKKGVTVSGLDRCSDAERAILEKSMADENAAFRDNPPKGDDLLKWKYQRYMTNYLRCVNGVDTSVGRILDYLKEAGLEENTIVVYSSDQGFFLGEHGWFDKRFPHEESVRMPLVVRWPGKLKAGSRIPALVQNTDFLPTFLDLAGRPTPADMHGSSMLPLLSGQKSRIRDAAYTHFYEDTHEHHAAAYVAVRTDDKKLVRYYERGVTEMYDLKKDPDELHNVADNPAYAGARATLEKQLAGLASQYGDKTAPWGDDTSGEVPARLRVTPKTPAAR